MLSWLYKDFYFGEYKSGNTGIFTIVLRLASQTIGTTTSAERLSVVGNFRATGNITLANSATIQSNSVICWLASGNLGYCSSVVAADGTCTCNSINS